MSPGSRDRDGYKRQAAEAALAYVRPGMVLGLGHGSTAIHALRGLAAQLRAGLLWDVAGVPCSEAVAREARELGLPLTTLEAHPTVDLTIDGADEIDPDLNLIKGAGGALLREKIVARASRQLVIVADESKLSPSLGTARAVPVEVVPFGWRLHVAYFELQGARWELRRDRQGRPFVTDHGHWLLDCHFASLEDPVTLAARLKERTGVVEHGLFLGLATEVIVAGPTGVRRLSRPRGTAHASSGQGTPRCTALGREA